MRKQAGLTRIDVAVALACVALVLAQAGVINAGGRERSKREVCMANLRTLTAAWQVYADDNAGKIVNGGQYDGFAFSNNTGVIRRSGIGARLRAVLHIPCPQPMRLAQVGPQ